MFYDVVIAAETRHHNVTDHPYPNPINDFIIISSDASCN